MIRRILAYAFLLAGLGSIALSGPGVWHDTQIDTSTLVETTAYDPPDGGCSESLGIFITCGFAVTESKTFEVTLFDYIHLQAGAPQDRSAVPMQTPDGALTLSYGIETLGSRIQFLVIALGLIVLGGLLLIFGRGRS